MHSATVTFTVCSRTTSPEQVADTQCELFIEHCLKGNYLYVYACLLHYDSFFPKLTNELHSVIAACIGPISRHIARVPGGAPEIVLPSLNFI